MKSSEFAYWLMGFFEISGDIKSLNEEQIQMIRKHLALVFYHEIDPSYTKDPTKQQEMNDIHGTPIKYDFLEKPPFLSPPHLNNDSLDQDNQTIYRC